jgi:hypothetical protein
VTLAYLDDNKQPVILAWILDNMSIDALPPHVAASLRAIHFRSRRGNGLANTVTMVALPVASETTISTLATMDLFFA